MNFTKEEIKLCKKIANKHRKEIVVGNWIHFEDGFYLVIEVVKTPEKVDIYATDFGVAISADDDFTPLWQISDCSEFLRERAVYLEGLNQAEEEYICYVGNRDDLGMVKGTIISFDGKTPLEALLKAVLAIVEEK